MQNIYHAKMKTPIGEITIVSNDTHVTNIYYHDEVPAFLANFSNGETDPCPVITMAKLELEQYFAGRLDKFTVPIAPTGGAFFKKVWGYMVANITFGETATYGEIATSCESPKGARAVGMANNKNPIPIIIPCHRIVGADGKLVGFRWGMDAKEFLLKLEGTIL